VIPDPCPVFPKFLTPDRGPKEKRRMQPESTPVTRSGPTTARKQRWADCENFQSESSPYLIKLNPTQSWSAKFLKIISPIQYWSANVKSCIFILPHEAKQQLELFCLEPNTIGWSQNSSSSAFESRCKI